MPTSTRTTHIHFYDTLRQNGRAHRADRGVRPYRTLCVFADGACNFVIASCRGERGIDPYGHLSLSPFVVRFRLCVLHGRGKPLPYVTTKRGDSSETMALLLISHLR